MERKYLDIAVLSGLINRSVAVLVQVGEFLRRTYRRVHQIERVSPRTRRSHPPPLHESSCRTRTAAPVEADGAVDASGTRPREPWKTLPCFPRASTGHFPAANHGSRKTPKGPKMALGNPDRPDFLAAIIAYRGRPTILQRRAASDLERVGQPETGSAVRYRWSSGARPGRPRAPQAVAP